MRSQGFDANTLWRRIHFIWDSVIMLRVYFTCLLLSVCFTAQAADVYQWQDENGITHYGQTPPSDVNAKQMRVPAPPPVDAEKAQQEIDALIAEQRQAEAEAEAREDNQREAQAQADMRAENCKIARRNLETYQNNPGRRFQNADGEVTRPTEEERQKKISEFKQQTERFCSQ